MPLWYLHQYPSTLGTFKGKKAARKMRREEKSGERKGRKIKREKKEKRGDSTGGNKRIQERKEGKK